MFDAATLLITLGTTFASQSIYYCLVKFPPEIEQKTRLLKAETESLALSAKDSVLFGEAAKESFEIVESALTFRKDSSSWNATKDSRQKHAKILTYKFFECRGLSNPDEANPHSAFEKDFLSFLNSLAEKLQTEELDQDGMEKLFIEYRSFETAVRAATRRQEIQSGPMLARISNVTRSGLINV